MKKPWCQLHYTICELHYNATGPVTLHHRFAIPERLSSNPILTKEKVRASTK